MKTPLHIVILISALLLVGCQTQSIPENTIARIALVSDTHTAVEGNKAPLFRKHLEEVIADVNAARVDLVLIAGDLTEIGTQEQVAAFKQQIHGFNPPVLYVVGNHDVGAKFFPNNKSPVTMEKLSEIEEQLGPTFFAKDRAGLRIVGVNGSLFGSGLSRETEMWQFLERELAKPSKKQRILLSHYPPFTENVDEPGGAYWNIEPEPRQRLLSLLKSGDVNTVLSGHLHRPLIKRHDGILFVTGIPVSFSTTPKTRPGWTLVTIRRQEEAHVEYKELPVESDILPGAK